MVYRRITSLFLLSCTITMWSTAGFAKAETTVAFEEGASFEEWLPQPAASGGELIGLRLNGLPEDDNRLVQAYVPAAVAGQDVCLLVKAEAGRYFRKQGLRVKGNWTGGIAEVPITTTYNEPPKQLSAVRRESAITRLDVGSCDALPEEVEMLISSWKTSLQQDFVSIDFFIKAGERDVVDLAIISGGMPPVIRCSKSVTEGLGVFTHTCRVGRELLNNNLDDDVSARFEVARKSEEMKEGKETTVYGGKTRFSLRMR